MSNEPNDLLAFSKISAARQRLSKKERMIADYILDHPEAMAACSALTLAQRTGTSSATVVRFCRSCGFSGWSEMKLYFQREILTEDSQHQRLKGTDSISVIKQKVQAYHESLLDNMVAQWDEENYEAAANAMADAKHILFAGVGGSQSATYTFMDTFLDLGIPCEYYCDPVISTYKTALLGPGDVMFVIMYTGSYTTLVEDMKLAQHNGATVILLCGVPDSPAVKYANITLLTSIIMREHMAVSISVRVAELIMIEVLYTLVEMELERRGRTKLGLDRYLNANRLPDSWPPAT